MINLDDEYVWGRLKKLVRSHHRKWKIYLNINVLSYGGLNTQCNSSQLPGKMMGRRTPEIRIV